MMSSGAGRQGRAGAFTSLGVLLSLVFLMGSLADAARMDAQETPSASDQQKKFVERLDAKVRQHCPGAKRAYLHPRHGGAWIEFEDGTHIAWGSSVLAIGDDAPPLIGEGGWLNVDEDQDQTGPDLTGQIVLVDFSATWCGPCRVALPAVQDLCDRYADQGLKVALVTDETAEIYRPYLTENEYTMPAVLDTNRETIQAYGVRGWPTCFLIDRRGKIAYVGDPRFLDKDQPLCLVSAIESALTGSQPANAMRLSRSRVQPTANAEQPKRIAKQLEELKPEQIDRSIQRQPEYMGKPAYMKLVLGPTAGKQIWMIVDPGNQKDDTGAIYLDLNANGDLTDPDERFSISWASRSNRVRSGRVQLPKLVDAVSLKEYTGVHFSWTWYRTGDQPYVNYVLTFMEDDENPLYINSDNIANDSESAPVYWLDLPNRTAQIAVTGAPGMHVGVDYRRLKPGEKLTVNLKVGYDEFGREAITFSEYFYPANVPVTGRLRYTDRQGNQKTADFNWTDRCCGDCYKFAFQMPTDAAPGTTSVLEMKITAPQGSSLPNASGTHRVEVIK